MKFLVWDEKAIRTKKKRSRGALVNQMEKLYVLLPEQQALSFKKRKHFAGTTHGDVIGPIMAPAWDDEEETWNMTYQQKKDLFGSSNRIRVGGEKPDGESEKSARRLDTDVEPVAYHALPSEVVNELMKRLEAKCWDGMMKPESPLYEPLLAAIFSGQKGNRKASVKAKAKTRSTKNAKKKKEKEDDDEDDDDEEEDPDKEEDDDEDLEEEDDLGEDDDDKDQEEDEEEEDADEDAGEDEPDEEEPKQGTKRKSSSSAGTKTGRGKGKGKGKRKGVKSAPKAKGRPKAGNKQAKNVLDKLKGLM